MHTGSIGYLKKFLTTEISLEGLYYNALAKLTNLKANTNKYEFNKSDNDLINYDFSKFNTSIKTLNPLYVLIRRKTIEYEVNINNTVDFLAFNTFQIHESQPIHTLIRWRNSDLSFFTQIRQYYLKFTAEINTVLNQDISLKTQIKTNKIDEDAMELDRRIRTTEEIIKIDPYIKKVKKEVLYRVPVVKKNLPKQYFSNEEITNFREILAKQAKTRKTNIELVSIYDKFDVDIYSSIKQDASSKNLICYLNNKISKDSSNIYYLIIGTQKDTNEVVKALAPAS